GVRFLTFLLANGRENFTLRAELNWRVLSATLVVSVVCGVLFGLAPAIQSTRPEVMPQLKQIRASGSPVARRRQLSLGHVLVVSQIGLSLLLLVAAGLFVRTLSNLQSIELGFNRENVLLFQVDARKAGHKDPEIAAFYGDLRKRFSAIPGVRSASLGQTSLIQSGHGLPISVVGSPRDPANRYLTVGPAFFATMQIPILAGRDFQESDRPGAPRVSMFSQVFAKTNFGDRNPLGQRLILREALRLEAGPAGKGNRIARDMEIVGVSANDRYGGLKRDIPPVVYIPYDQGYPQPDQMVYTLRTSGDPLQYVNSVREI